MSDGEEAEDSGAPEDESEGEAAGSEGEAAGSEGEAAGSEDRERDPFGRLEESVGDREGDPFEYLSDPDADEGAGTSRTATGTETGVGQSSPETGGDATVRRTGAGKTDAAEAEADDAAVEEVTEPRVRPGTPEVGAGDAGARTGDPFESVDSAFQKMDVSELDEAKVWESLSAAEARGSVAEAGKRTYAEVSKHSYCETCRYFSGPPDVGCTHEGTEILEFVDMETVRVVDCPVVEERRALERGDDPKEV